jgi:hypothetical protein
MSPIEAGARLFSANGTIVVVIRTTTVSDKLWDLEDMAALLDKAALPQSAGRTRSVWRDPNDWRQ